MIELIVAFLIVMGLVSIIYYLSSIFSEKFLVKHTDKYLNYFIVLILLIAFIDFMIGAVYPFSNDITYLLIGLVTSIILVPIIISLRCIYPFDIVKNSNNKRLLSFTIGLVAVTEIIAFLNYLVEIVASSNGITQLVGTSFIFDVDASIIFNYTSLGSNDPNLLVYGIIIVIKSLYLIVHHSSIVLAYFGVLLIFSEWGVVMRDPIIGFFKLFSYGYLLQGIGQIIVSFWLIFDSLGISINLERIQFIGGAISTAGVVIYYFSFALACLNLLSNIEHLVFPQWLINTFKGTSIIIPTIYGIIYSLMLAFSIIGQFANVDSILKLLLDLTHITDYLGVWIVPLAAGMFFIVAYIRSKEKPNVKFSSFLVLAVFSVLLLFYSGNNTMTVITWQGLIHGPLGIIGILFFMYALSRVGDHASRHRQVIRKIRESPEDFMFLAELGRSERKLKAWAKVDTMVKEGVIKSLTPVEKKDDTKVAMEMNSYMTEIQALYEARKRKRAARNPTGA